jgi:hypothetical protein
MHEADSGIQRRIRHEHSSLAMRFAMQQAEVLMADPEHRPSVRYRDELRDLSFSERHEFA